MDNNDSKPHRIAGDMEEIRTQLNYLTADIKQARREVALLRDEVRREITAVRTDTAIVVSRQNSAINDVKKSQSDCRWHSSVL